MACDNCSAGRSGGSAAAAAPATGSPFWPRIRAKGSAGRESAARVAALHHGAQHRAGRPGRGCGEANDELLARPQLHGQNRADSVGRKVRHNRRNRPALHCAGQGITIAWPINRVRAWRRRSGPLSGEYVPDSTIWRSSSTWSCIVLVTLNSTYGALLRAPEPTFASSAMTGDRCNIHQREM